MSAAYPLLTLWRACQSDDDALAFRLITQARDEGATPLQVARARRERADRIAAQTFRIGDAS